MSGLQFRDPVRAISGAAVFAGARVTVSTTGTDTLVPIFAEPSSVPLSNPILADSAGWLPAIYADSAGVFRIRMTDENGVELRLEDDIGGDLLPLALPYADPRDSNGAVMPGATRTFYAARTTELSTVYANQALTTPQDNPVEADADGEFPEVWLDVELSYRVQLHDQYGRLLYDVEHLAFAPGEIPPTAPVLSGVVDGTDFDLSWTESTSQFSLIAGYRLFNAADDTLIFDTEDPEDRDYTFGPLVEGNTYSFYVRAYDENDLESENSNVVSISVQAAMEVITASTIWVKPENLLSVDVVCIGAGGGGGGGVCGSAGTTNRCGGAGAGAGGYSSDTFDASELGATEDVTVGLGGLGGAATSGGTFGNDGADGGETSFGSHLVAGGGKGGDRGYSIPTGGGASPAGGTGGVGTSQHGGDGANGTFINEEAPGVSRTIAPGGGGGGSGRTPTGSGTPCDGGAGDTSDENNLGGPRGATNGASGAAGESTATHHSGGGGGGGRTSATGTGQAGGSGGAGGLYGGGGGGGGSGTIGSGNTSGPGGNGAQGVVVLFYTYAS